MRGESLEVKSERLPEGWKCEKIKYIVSLRTSHSLNNKNFIGLENVASWSGELTNHQSDSVPEGETMQVNKRDVLFGKLRPYLAKVYLAENDACCSPEFLVLRANEDKILPHLLKYIFLNHQIIDEINKSTYGTKMPRASWNFIGNLTVSLPSLTSQFSLITFLDRKCAEIDELAALQETMIAELKRYKQSVITEAVTKGLDKNVKLKDSGVEWIGKIPEGWEVNKLNRLFSIIGSGTTPKATNEDNFEGDVNWIQSGDINGGYLTNCKNQIAEQVLLQYSALKIYKQPFIVVAMYGASVGNISISKIDGCVNQACCVLSSSKQCFDFLFYAIKSAKDYLIYRAEGGGQPNISQDKLKSLWLAVPPLAEQQAIADFLDEKCGEIDELIAIKQQKIEQLKEYKKSVIFEYVTGKKEV